MRRLRSHLTRLQFKPLWSVSKVQVQGFLHVLIFLSALMLSALVSSICLHQRSNVMSSVSLSKDLEHLNLPAMLFNYLFWHGGMTFSKNFSARDQVVSARTLPIVRSSHRHGSSSLDLSGSGVRAQQSIGGSFIHGFRKYLKSINSTCQHCGLQRQMAASPRRICYI